MAITPTNLTGARLWVGFNVRGIAIVLVIIALAAIFFKEGLYTLFEAWKLPEYSHGPLIPILSVLLFVRHLKMLPEYDGPIDDRWPGVALVLLSIVLALAGKIAAIGDIVAYALIGFIGGMVLTSFGWRRGAPFWPALLHLVFMLPLPGTIYWKVSTNLQLISSELGVALIQMAGVPVFLDGNIIDLGVYKLHVAEACSGLRYLYPVMSFSYVFASLYRGPLWIKAILLLSAAPITVVMNSVRIGIIGIIVNHTGIEHVEGITHLLEGWVIFITSIVLLFLLVKVMMLLHGSRGTLAEALDLDLSGIPSQLARLRLIQPSAAMLSVLAIVALTTTAWSLAPERAAPVVERQSLDLFPTRVGGWRNVAMKRLDPEIEAALGADDYLSADFVHPDMPAAVDVFVAWYRDQTQGGIHSPEVCLPGGGWEMEYIERVDIASTLGSDESFVINRAVIQKGETRLLVYYWFEQYGGRLASDYIAKANLVYSGLLYGRTDGALVRLITPIRPVETADIAEERLRDMLTPFMDNMAAFVPTR